jgi:FkbM family methyltransferase
MFESINRTLQRIYNFLRINSIIFNSYLRNLVQRKQYNFIQIGANDGKSGDPIFYLINLFSFKGVLVEPVPYVFKKLEYNYRKNKNVFLENSAISAAYDDLEFFYLQESENSDLPSWYDQIGSFNYEVLIKHKPSIKDFDKLLTSVKVNTSNFEELLEKYKFKNFDLIFIDTEGYDYEIIKIIPFDKIDPSVIIFEHKHLSKEEVDNAIKLLSDKNYNLFRTVDDFVFYK